MAQDSMFRVNVLSKDLGMKTTKELTAFLDGIGITDKKTSSSLTPEEFNLFFNEHFQRFSQIIFSIFSTLFFIDFYQSFTSGSFYFFGVLLWQ